MRESSCAPETARVSSPLSRTGGRSIFVQSFRCAAGATLSRYAKCYLDWLCILRAEKEEKNSIALVGLFGLLVGLRPHGIPQTSVNNAGRYCYRNNILLQIRRANYKKYSFA